MKLLYLFVFVEINFYKAPNSETGPPDTKSLIAFPSPSVRAVSIWKRDEYSGRSEGAKS